MSPLVVLGLIFASIVIISTVFGWVAIKSIPMKIKSFWDEKNKIYKYFVLQIA